MVGIGSWLLSSCPFRCAGHLPRDTPAGSLCSCQASRRLEVVGFQVHGSSGSLQIVEYLRRRVGPLSSRPRLLFDVVSLVLPSLINAALVIPFLTSRSFWVDEGFTYQIVVASEERFAEALATYPTMPLYYAVLSGWVPIFGTSELAMRSFSALCSIATGPLTYLATRRSLGQPHALLAASLVAANPLVVWYGSEARGYALSLLLTVVAAAFLLRGLNTWRAGDWGAFVIAAILAVYAQLTALLVIAAFGLASLLHPEARRRWRRLGTVGVILAASTGPLVLTMAINAPGTASWAAHNTVGRLITTLTEALPPLLHLALVCLTIGIPLVAAWAVLTRVDLRRRWSVLFPIVWLIAPLWLMTVYALLISPAFVIRYFLGVVPAAAILAAIVIARFPRRAGLVASALVLAASAVSAIVWEPGSVEDWGLASEYVARSAEPGDGLLVYEARTRVVFDVYWQRAGRAGDTEPVYPPIPWEQTDALLLNDLDEFSYEPARIREHALGYDRIWLVLSHAGDDSRPLEAIRTALDDSYEIRSRRSFRGVDVEEHVRRDAAASRNAPL
jgi:mannosyltransferase